jgi:hypothetical protein
MTLILLLFLHADLLNFFDMQAFVEVVKVRRVIGFSRADSVIFLFKVIKFWWKAM